MEIPYGSILWRGIDAMETLEPGDDGDLLTLSNRAPAWVSSAVVGASGIWVSSHELYPYQTNERLLLNSIPALELSCSGVTGGITFVLRMRQNGNFTPSLVRLIYHVPEDASGGAVLFLRTRTVSMYGKPKGEGDVVAYMEFTGGKHRWDWMDIPIIDFGEDILGYSFLVGRDADHRGDTYKGSLDLLGVYIF